jgi:ADP-heptose:LPS heptosyltransferase
LLYIQRQVSEAKACSAPCRSDRHARGAVRFAKKDGDCVDEVGRLAVMRQDANTPVRGEPAARAGEAVLTAEYAGATPAPWPVRTILVCRPNSRLGNTVLLTPLLQEIERTLPHARIDLLSSFPGAAQLFARFPGIGTIHALPARGAGQPLRYAGALLQAAAIRYDAVIDPEPQSWTSGFVTRLMRGSCKVGFDSPRKRRASYLSVPVEGAPQHMGTFPVYLFRRTFLGLDAASSRAGLPVLDIRLSAAEREAGSQQLRGLARPGRPIMAIAGAATGTKQYTVEWWRALVRALRERTPALQIVEIRPPSGESSFPELQGYSSRNLREVASVIGGTSCFVCADSGLMHLGAASLCPTVGLFKVTNPQVYAPYGPSNIALIIRGDSVDEVAAQATARLARALGAGPGL